MTAPDVPNFVRESFEGEEASSAPDEKLLSSLAQLPAALPKVPPSDAVLARLMAQVEELPHRYAPFLPRIATLLELDEAAAEKLLSGAAEASAWRFGGLPGLRTFDVTGGPSLGAAQTFFIRFAPGARLPEHRHEGREQVLILEGGYREYSGKVYEAGDLHEMAAGSTHGFVVFPNEPCVALAVYRGRLRFSSLILRWLSRAMGR
ncbi:MAG: cupin domain-containing protein [Polyangiaceae bacterium]|nr:cupin domain-containing protein [Polyangiaceae bacterium]